MADGRSQAPGDRPATPQQDARAHAEIGRDLEDEVDTCFEDIEADMDDDLGDELLSLTFTACHPVSSPEARTALTLA